MSQTEKQLLVYEQVIFYSYFLIYNIRRISLFFSWVIKERLKNQTYMTIITAESSSHHSEHNFCFSLFFFIFCFLFNFWHFFFRFVFFFLSRVRLSLYLSATSARYACCSLGGRVHLSTDFFLCLFLSLSLSLTMVCAKLCPCWGARYSL